MYGLYPWLNIEGSPMAYIVRNCHEFTIDLPGVANGGIILCQVTMRYESSMTEVRYSFILMVGYVNSCPSVSVEWCRSEGNEVKSLWKSSLRWKLVRLGPTQTAITYHDIPATRDNNTETGTRHNLVLARPRRSALDFLVTEKRLLLFSQGLKASHPPCTMLDSFNTWEVEPSQR